MKCSITPLEKNNNNRDKNVIGFWINLREVVIRSLRMTLKKTILGKRNQKML